MVAQLENKGSATVRVKDDLSRFLREAETQEVVITRHGKPAGVLIGFKSEDDCSTTDSKMIRGFCRGRAGASKPSRGPRRQIGRRE